MKSKILYSLLFVFLFVGSIRSQESSKITIPSEVSVSHTKHFWIESEHALGEKFLIKIFLPKNYFKSDTTKYPVVYLTDGDTFFGAATELSYFVHFGNPSIIIVGICYGSWETGFQKRGSDFRPYPDKEGNIGAKNYLSFLRDELIPKVESEYRIDSLNRTLFGWSAGGRLALYGLFQQPDLFKNYFAFGAPLTNNERWAFAMEEKYYQAHKDLPGHLYLGIGEFDSGYPGNVEFYKILQSRNYVGLKYDFEVIKDFRHEYRTAVALLEIKLRDIFHGKDIIPIILDAINKEGIEHAISEYSKLKNERPDYYNFGDSQLNSVGYYLLGLNKVDDAMRIFKLNVKQYPDDWNLYDSLAEAYLIKGNYSLALKNYNKALELCPESEKENVNSQIKKIKER